MILLRRESLPQPARPRRAALLLALASVLALALAVRWPAPPALSANLERELVRLIGAPVQWQAPMQLALWPRPHLRLEQLRAAWDNAAAPPRLAVQRLDVFFALRPFGGQILRLTGLRFHAPDLLLQRGRAAKKAGGAQSWLAWPQARIVRALRRGTERSRHLRFVELQDGRVRWRAAESAQEESLHQLTGRLARAGASSPWRLQLEGAHGAWPMEIEANLGAWGGARVPLAWRWRQTNARLAAAFDGHLETRADGELSGELRVEGASLAHHVLRPLGLRLAGSPQPRLRGVVRAREGQMSLENFVFTSAAGRMFVALHLRAPPSPPAPLQVEARLRMGALQLDDLWARRAVTFGAQPPPDDWFGWWWPRLAGAVEGRAAFSAAHMALGGAALQLEGALEFAPHRVRLDELRLSLPQAGALLAQGEIYSRPHAPRFVGSLSLRSAQSRNLIAWLLRAGGGNPQAWLRALPAQAWRDLEAQAQLRVDADGFWLDEIQAWLDGVQHRGEVHRRRAQPARLEIKWRSDLLALDMLGIAAAQPKQQMQQKQQIQEMRQAFLRAAPRLFGAPGEWQLDLRAARLRFGGGLPDGEALELELFGRAQELAVRRAALNLVPEYAPPAQLTLSGRLQPLRAAAPFALGGWLDLTVRSADARPWLARLPFLHRLGEGEELLPLPLQAEFYWRAAGGDKADSARLSGEGQAGASKWRFQLASPAQHLMPLPAGAHLSAEASGPAQEWRRALTLAPERRGGTLAPELRGGTLAPELRAAAQDTVAQDDAQLVLRLRLRADGGLEGAAQLALSGAAARLQGVVQHAFTRPRFAGRVALEGEDWTRIWPSGFMPALAAAQPASFRAAAHLWPLPKGLAFSRLQAAWGANQLHGQGVWRWDGARPHLAAHVHFPQLALSERLFAADALLDWQAFAAFNAAVEWSADRLDWRGWQAQNLRASLRLHDSVAEFRPASARLYGGRAEGSLRLEGGALIPSLRAQGRVRDLQLASLLARVWNKPPLAARLSGAFALKSQGRTWRAHRAQMEGGGALQLEEGWLAGLDAAALTKGAAQLESLDDIAPLLARSFGRGASEFALWRGRYDWRDGVLTLRDARLVLRDGLGEGQLALRYDARANRLDSALDMQLALPSPQAKKLPPVRLQLSGAPAAPELRFVTDALADGLAEQVLRQDALGELGLPPALP